MKFQCVNLRGKKGPLSPTTFNNDAIDVENAYFFPASLTEEFGKILMETVLLMAKMKFTNLQIQQLVLPIGQLLLLI